jgi:hypothetical protein
MIDDYTVQSIIDQLNSAHRKYSDEQEHLAWQQGLLIGVLAWAIKNDSAVRDHLEIVIQRYNENANQTDDVDMFDALDSLMKN